MAFSVGTKVKLKTIITDGDPDKGVYGEADAYRFRGKVGDVVRNLPGDRIRVEFDGTSLVCPSGWLKRV